jgi:hypothetical protein
MFSFLKKKPMAENQEDLTALTAEQLIKIVVDTREELTVATELNDELQKKLEQKPATPSALPTVDFKGETYAFTAPKFKLDSVVITAEEAAKNTEVIGKLIDAGSDLLRKL